MPSCIVKQCKNSSSKHSKNTGITFHRFPTDPVRRDQWSILIRRNRHDEYWRPSKSSVICSLHFDEEDFYTTKGDHRFLVRDAYPKQFADDAPGTAQPCKSQLIEIAQQQAEYLDKVTTGSRSPSFAEELSFNNDENQIRKDQKDSVEDKYDVLGKYIASILRQLETHQKMFVEKIIHEAIFEGQMGNLNVNSKLVVNTNTYYDSSQSDGIIQSVEGVNLEKNFTGIKNKIAKDEPVDILEAAIVQIEGTPDGLCPDSVSNYNKFKIEYYEQPEKFTEVQVEFAGIPIKVEIVTEDDPGLLGESDTEYCCDTQHTLSSYGGSNCKRKKDSEDAEIHTQLRDVNEENAKGERNTQICDKEDTVFSKVNLN